MPEPQADKFSQQKHTPLGDVREQAWQKAIAQRYELTRRPAVPLLDEILITYEQAPQAVLRQRPMGMTVRNRRR